MNEEDFLITMPYLSHNYRFETKSRAKSLAESFVFVIISAVAIFFTLFVLGWISTSAAEAAEIIISLA